MTPIVPFSENPVFTQDNWSRPDDANQGASTSQEVYEAVGFALSCWELMEEEFADLYLRLLKAPKSSDNPARRGFGAIESNSSRRKVVIAAAEARFGARWADPVMRKAFLLVPDAMSRAASRRDDIAHGIVLARQVEGVHFGYFLFPPDYNTERTTPRLDPSRLDDPIVSLAKYRFTGTQIRAFGFKFKELADAIRNHAGLLSIGFDAFQRVATGVSILGEKLG